MPYHAITLGEHDKQLELGLCDYLCIFIIKTLKQSHQTLAPPPEVSSSLSPSSPPPFSSFSSLLLSVLLPPPLSPPPSFSYFIPPPPFCQTVSLLSCFFISPLGSFAFLNTFVVRSQLPPHLFSLLPFCDLANFNESTVNNYGEVLTTLQTN